MDDSKLIKQLQERLEKLEQKLGQPEEKKPLRSMEVSLPEPEEENEPMSERSHARKHLMETLKEKYPGLFVTIAKRADGGGLLLTNRSDHSTYTLKFYYSKNYKKERLFSWFTFKTKDKEGKPLAPSDFYAMCVDYAGQYHYFIFTNEQLNELLSKKKQWRKVNSGSMEQIDIENFYFEAVGEGYSETREQDQNMNEYRQPVKSGFDVTKQYGAFDLIGKVVGPLSESNQSAFITSEMAFIKGKIAEILHQDAIISLKRSDFFREEILQYIEVNSDLMNFGIDADLRSQVHRVVVHVKAPDTMDLGTLARIVTQLKAIVGSHVYYTVGLSRSKREEIQTQVILIG